MIMRTWNFASRISKLWRVLEFQPSPPTKRRAWGPPQFTFRPNRRLVGTPYTLGRDTHVRVLVSRLFERGSPIRKLVSRVLGLVKSSVLACQPSSRTCQPSLRACQPSSRACQDGFRACQPPFRPCQPRLPTGQPRLGACEIELAGLSAAFSRVPNAPAPLSAASSCVSEWLPKATSPARHPP